MSEEMKEGQENTKQDTYSEGEFQSQLKNIIGNPAELLNFVTESNNSTINENGWFILDSILEYLKSNEVEVAKLDLYCKLLIKIAENTTPKEIYLGILEQFDPHVPLKLILFLLPSLKIVLRRLANEDIKACSLSLDMCYSSLYYYIEGMNVPEYKEFDPVINNEIKHDAQNIFQLLLRILDVVDFPFEKVLQYHATTSGITESTSNTFVTETFAFLCNLLNVLLKLDLNNYTENEEEKEKRETTNVDSMPNASSVSNLIVQFVHRLYTPLSLVTNQFWHGEFLTFRSEEEDAQKEEILIAETARSCYLYLIFCHHISLEKRPQVWSYEYLLCLCIKDVVCLTSHKSPVIVDKGLELCRAIFNQLNLESLSYENVSMLTPSSSENNHAENDEIEEVKSDSKGAEAKNIVKQIYTNMIAVAVFVPAKTLRTRAVDFIVKFSDKFKHEDRYIIVKYLLTHTKHSGVVGVLIHYAKEKIDIELNSKDCEAVFSKPGKLKALLDIMANLPNGTETDLLVYSDRIMPSLNLLRYLLLRDKDNTTKIFNYKEELKTKFLSPLRTGLNLSRAHYEAELKHCTKKKSKTEKPKGTDLTINGIPLPNLPVAQQKQTLQTALASFDMMEIVLSRVEELFE